MNDLYNRTLSNMENTVHNLAQRVPPPIKVSIPIQDGLVYRHVEKTIHQAIVQKLARLVSSLDAARLLMENGFVQEQASVQRMLDEIQEDITFLSFSIIFNDHTPLHQKYLDAFFEEEFDATSAIASTQKRPMIPRQKIQAYIARLKSPTQMDPCAKGELLRTISKNYSGYVHAASPQIMEMYTGNPPNFHIRGLHGTERHQEYRADLWNYFYRSINAFIIAAQAFGDTPLCTDILKFKCDFESQSGNNYQSKEWEGI